MDEQPTSLPLDASLIMRHNVACAASIIAANRNIKPKKGCVDDDMTKIINEVSDSYRYTIWYLEKHVPAHGF